MKEKIVIEKELLEKIIKASPIQWFDNKEKTDKIVIFGKEYKTEFVSETFEELKELCKGIKGVEFAGGNAKGEIIQLDNIWFAENGEIWGYSDNWEEVCNIAQNRTPAQMYQIIKNLIGEE